MTNTLKTIGQIAAWLGLWTVFSSVGFATDNPQLMVPAYAIFFLLVFGLVLIYVKSHKQVMVTNTKSTVLIKKISGIILLALSFYMPAWFVKGAHFTSGVYILITVLTIVAVAISTGAVIIINKNRKKNVVFEIIGYLILVLVSTLPAVAMVQYDNSYSALGTAYYAALAVAIFSWWGLSLFAVNKK
jgi:hypothetical protein